MLFTKFKTALDALRRNLGIPERENVKVESLLLENEKLRRELQFFKQESEGKIFDL